MMMAAIIIIIINGDNKKKIKYPGCPFQIIYIQFKYQIDSNEKKTSPDGIENQSTSKNQREKKRTNKQTFMVACKEKRKLKWKKKFSTDLDHHR